MDISDAICSLVMVEGPIIAINVTHPQHFFKHVKHPLQVSVCVLSTCDRSYLLNVHCKLYLVQSIILF